MTDRAPDMKGDWDRRARENARYYIATTNWESDEKFRTSGRRDVDAFFSDIEHLLTPNTVVLDIGCGGGRMDEFVAPRVGRLIGIDVSGEMVRWARERLAGVPNLSFLEGDGVSLQAVDDRSIDLVFSHVVFHHCPRAVFDGYLPEVLRVLRPGGSFVFQMAEALDDGFSMPSDEDTFSMRAYDEADVWRELDGAGFERRACKRFALDDPDACIEYLRFHASRPA